MITPRRDHVALQFAELLRDFEQRRTADGDTAMRELTGGAALALPGASCAGITVATRSGEVRTVSATGPDAEKVDDIQRRNAEGPCLEAAWEQHTMRIRDMATESRWPGFCRDTLSDTAVRSILSFQLFKTREAMGALNFYADRADAFDDESIELGLMLATHTAVAWNLLERDEQFRSALASRDVIGQAKGMLMERFSIDAGAAFELLKRLSQDSNTPLVSIAEQLIRSSPLARHAHE
jgi:ANTAR domain/GAF domain